jgi:hypothetical protein
MTHTDFFRPRSPAGRSHLAFFRQVEADLRLRHVPFDQAELLEFVADVWPLVEPGDRPERWAEALLVANQGA